jgi:hypothetical protein
MSNNSGYGYSPLEDGSIRLLQIEAVKNPSLNHKKAPIRCRIQHFQIAKAPKYRALSYACESIAPLFHFLTDNVHSLLGTRHRAQIRPRGIDVPCPNSKLILGDNMTTDFINLNNQLVEVRKKLWQALGTSVPGISVSQIWQQITNLLKIAPDGFGSMRSVSINRTPPKGITKSV